MHCFGAVLLSHCCVMVPITPWHHDIMAWFWHCDIMAQFWYCGIMVQFWHHGIMVWVLFHTVALQHPLCSHASSTRFHWLWAHMNCLPDLIVLVSIPWTHSSLASPQCAPSPWPDASGAKKMQWVQRYIQRLCTNMFLFVVHSLPPFGCCDLQYS